MKSKLNWASAQDSYMSCSEFGKNVAGSCSRLLGGRHLDGILDRRANTLLAAVEAFLRVVGAFDAEHDFVGETCRIVGSPYESA